MVHHGREFRVMTNDPPYNEQLELLKGHDFSHPSSDSHCPETSTRATESRAPLISQYDADAED